MSGKGPQSLISFGEIAKRCANHFNRTIIENDAWKRREWVALGKLLEALFANQLGEVKIQSDGMTEADAINLDGSLAAFLSRQPERWAGIRFASACRPPQWDSLFTSTEAQSCADAYVRRCLITTKAADKWLAGQNIVARKMGAEGPERQTSRGRGRPKKSSELSRVERFISGLISSHPSMIRELLGGKKASKSSLAEKIADKIDIAPKTIRNRYHKQLVLVLDALKNNSP